MRRSTRDFRRAAVAASAAAAIGIVALLAPATAPAHGLEPALLVLRETGGESWEVTWRSSALRLPGAEVRPRLPDECRPTSAPRATADGDRIRQSWTVDCAPGGLAGRSLAVADLDVAKIVALVVVERRDGERLQAVLNAASPSFAVPARTGPLDVAWGYARLGIEHILAGADHLLFVLGLLLLVSGRRALVRTVTGFTIGHSITLSAAALGVARAPARPVELLIALSILALAVELARGERHRGLLRRFPWAVATGFGLLHGFGFAGALADAGLPDRAIPLALVSFNAGIELGQLAFVAAALLAWRMATALRPAPSAARPVAVYAIGILAAFWSLERAALWLAG